jgi:CubicO group peptidase (beta-lactamase class C family)
MRQSASGPTTSPATGDQLYCALKSLIKDETVNRKVRTTRALAVSVLVVCCGLGECAAAAKPQAAAIDAVFAAWTGEDRPGCALAVTQRGAVVYARGYGMANLEAGLANAPDVVFDIGSVSKQFTAMAVLLLVEDGRVSLDDDVRKHLPEIPDYGRRITVSDLLHHTSGLRNYTDLFDLAGIPEVSLTTARDAYELIVRQAGVNFPAGREFLYSDTNYFLAGEIVRRVSGRSLREFAAERIFGPLGMTNTRFEDQPREVIRRRAVGYEPIAAGYLNYLGNFEQVGDGSVLTTVLDLARWDHNFDEPVVGGKQAIEWLTSPGKLADGTPISYGMGLFIDDYRGLPWIHHDGEWVGYRAAISRFPSERLSVLVTCNSIGSLEPMDLALGVADVYLHDRWHDPSAAASADDPSRHAGLYWSPEHGTLRRFEVHDGYLTLGGASVGDRLSVVGPDAYRSGGENATAYHFVTPTERAPWALEARRYGTLARYYRVTVPASPPRTDDFAGVYDSGDLPQPWQLVAESGRLLRRQSSMHDVVLEPVFADTFVGSLSEGAFLAHFVRGQSGEVTGVLVSGELMRPMLLTRRRGQQ